MFISACFVITVAVTIWILYCDKTTDESKYLYKSIYISIAVFIYLFIVSMVYRVANDGRAFLGLIPVFKRIAKSAHFAVNALVTPSLFDLNSYTGDVLRWVQRTYGETSFTYICLGFTLLVAPLCSAAWLISLFSAGFWPIMSIGFFFWRRHVVFLNSSPKTIMLAKKLRDKYKKSIFVFCRYPEHENGLTEDELTDIREIRGKCIKSNERDLNYLFKEYSIAVLVVDSVNELHNYFSSSYRLPFTKGEMYIIADESKEEIKQYVSFSEGVTPLSFYNSVSNNVISKIKQDNNLVYIISDDTIAQMIYTRIINSSDITTKGYVYERTSNGRLAEKSHKNLRFYYKDLDEIKAAIKSSITSSAEVKTFYLVTESDEDNLGLKEFIIECEKSHKPKSQIIVYCKKEWLRIRGKKFDDQKKIICEYIGEDDLIMKDVASSINIEEKNLINVFVKQMFSKQQIQSPDH